MELDKVAPTNDFNSTNYFWRTGGGGESDLGQEDQTFTLFWYF